jgi:lipopolysaccharide export LptBFGC system permease protein LptF
MARYIEPVLADLQAEYEEAVRRGRTWQSRWIWIRGHAAFLAAIVGHGCGHAVRILQNPSADDRSALLRTCAWGAATMIAATVLLAAAPLQSFGEAGRRDAAQLVIYLVPQALPLSIPFGLTLGVIWGMGRSGVSLHSRVAVLLTAAALSAGSFGLLGWLVPSSNQAFRVAIFGRTIAQGERQLRPGQPPKGANELTLGELRRFLDPAANPQAWPPPDDSRALALNYHRRWATACAPLVVSFFALVVIGSGRCSRRLLAIASVVAIVGYHVLGGVATLEWLPPALAAWSPNAVFVCAGIAGIRRRSPRSTPASA